MKPNVSGPFQVVSKYLAFGCAAIAAIALLNSSPTPKPTITTNLPSSQRTIAQPQPQFKPQPQPQPQRQSQPQPQPSVSLATKTQPTSAPADKGHSKAAPTPTGDDVLFRIEPLPPTASPITVALPPSDSPQPPEINAPPLPPARDIPSVSPPQESATDQPTLSLDLAAASDAIRVQQRLNEMGYLVGLDGKWGPRSKAALRAFRVERTLEMMKLGMSQRSTRFLARLFLSLALLRRLLICTRSTEKSRTNS